ncbi:MAG TPA: amidohydrolase family protein, partial [Thermoanaerobaculia bacterium]|nr:amidohydrolase family protein [Thermoanaerobaculia bacterium]
MLALSGATIYTSPFAEAIRDGTILIDNGVIVAVGTNIEVPPHAERRDCSGLTITSAFHNHHVHFFERKWADVDRIPAAELEQQLDEMLTRYGFTSVFDLGSPFANTRKLRERIESGEVRGPRIRTTGEGLIARGTAPSDTVLHMMGVMKTSLPEISKAYEATEATRRLLDNGVDGIKLFVGPTFPIDAIEAAVTEAHRDNKPVFVHPYRGADVLSAVRAGVDVIAHTTPHSGPWDDELLRAIEASNATLTPTLLLWKTYARHDRTSFRDTIVNTAIEQLRAWRSTSRPILFGTDLGAVDYDPTEEYALMADAGMT